MQAQESTSYNRVPGVTFNEFYNLIDQSGIMSLDSYNTWCIDSRIRLGPAFSLKFLIFSGSEEIMLLQNKFFRNKYNFGEVMDQINWLLNNRISHENRQSFQAAIWILLQQPVSASTIAGYSQQIAESLIAESIINGQNFKASAGEVHGLLAFDGYGGTFLQPQLIVTEACEITLNISSSSSSSSSRYSSLEVLLLRDLNGDSLITNDEIVDSKFVELDNSYTTQINFKSLVANIKYKITILNKNSKSILGGSGILELQDSENLIMSISI